MEEKSDTQEKHQQPPQATSNNPLYCSYVDGKFTYKDPSTSTTFYWVESEKKWVVKEETADPIDSNKLEEDAAAPPADKVMTPGTSQVQFDGENYTYTDPDGIVFVWDSGKGEGGGGAWFPKDPQPPSSSTPFTLPPSPPDLSNNFSSSSSCAQTIGFFNPNYSTQLTSPTTSTTTTTSDSTSASRRFYYASLSPTSMGVNDNPGLFLSPDDQVNNNDQVGSSNGEGETQVDEQVENELPPGWEKHEDASGAYYWHVKSGTIQRERPTVHSPVTSLVTQMSSNPALMIPGGMSGFVRRSNTVVGGLGSAANTENNRATMEQKRRSWVNYLEDDKPQVQEQRHHMPAYEVDKNALKFAAVSLGCLSISEEDLTPERSSRAVSKVIAELTTSGKDGNARGTENPSRIWTHTEFQSSTQQMYLELTDSHLRVRVTTTQHQQPVTVLEQPIHSIRVWGVGREDPRDFAFVAREKQTRQFLCHVFRLDMYAKPLASSLRDACKKIMIERQQRVTERGSKQRPTSLGLKKNNNENKVVQSVAGLFPTPMDEPRKMIKAFYLGSKSVNKPTGMDVLNNAIDCLRSTVERIPVLVSVAPSVIGVTSTESPPKVQLEVRVRFLSFMGIGQDIRTCGIIIHTARDDFEAHCFYSTPSTGALCKAIEAACVLRYQKCLDAHHHGGAVPATQQQQQENGGGKARSNPESNSSTTATSPNSMRIASATASNLASALKNVFSNFGKAKSLSDEFMVRYQLSYGGEEPVSTPEPSSAATQKKDKPKVEAKKPEWFELDDSQNTHVYVSNLPLDINEEEFVNFMGKCGLVMKDTAGAWKCKLYRDKNGGLKGDGVCTYIKVDSVTLALQILDGSFFKSNQIHVERARFQLKGEYDATKKPKQKKKKDKLKEKKAQEALFSWKPDKLRGQRGKNEKVVVVKHAFSPEEFEHNVELILELKEDFKSEADKFGSCRKVDIFDNNTDGALKIHMSTPEEADAVIQNYNGRFFGGKQLEAYTWDGHEKLNVVETEAERKARLERWEKYVDEEDEGSQPKVARLDGNATPPLGSSTLDSDDDKAYDDD